jgi:NADPH:quinone reductase-like Zn-dependent oxidoreductase
MTNHTIKTKDTNIKAMSLKTYGANTAFEAAEVPTPEIKAGQALINIEP